MSVECIMLSVMSLFNETCIGILAIQDIWHFTSRDMGNFPFYFKGYGILCSIFLFTFRDMGY